MKNKKAFTLIELLVVIAIIALLLSIIVPALKNAKRQATMAVCLANQKSFATAYNAFVAENNSRLPLGFITSDRSAWCAAPIDDAGNWATVANVTMQYRHNGIMAGALYPFISSVKAYHCPGDPRWIKGTALGDAPRYQIYHSYALPDSLRALPGTTDIIKISQIRSLASSYLFVEDAYDGSINSLNYDGWSFFWDRLSDPMNWAWWDQLGVYHNNAGTLSFMDGHSENHKWEDKRTIKFFLDRTGTDPTIGKGIPQPNNPDIRYMLMHWPRSQ